jgi:hypothetical protein
VKLSRWNHNIRYHPLILRAVSARCQQALRPGGTLAVVGCARSSSRTNWEHSAPIVWPPPETYPSMRQIGRRNLPGARYRRHLLWRYSLIWTKPGVHV